MSTSKRIFVLDDSVDFDGFVVPDRMEALLSSALENHRIRSTREHEHPLAAFISAWPATPSSAWPEEDDPDVGRTLKPRDVMFSRRIGADCSSAVSIRM